MAIRHRPTQSSHQSPGTPRWGNLATIAILACAVTVLTDAIPERTRHPEPPPRMREEPYLAHYGLSVDPMPALSFDERTCLRVLYANDGRETIAFNDTIDWTALDTNAEIIPAAPMADSTGTLLPGTTRFAHLCFDTPGITTLTYTDSITGDTHTWSANNL